MEKLRVALVVPGGLGTGKNNLGIPVLEQIIKRLSMNFDLVVFQLFPVNSDYEVRGYILIPVYSKNPLIKTLKFFWTFWDANRQKRFKVIHGFWAIPGGLYAVAIGWIFRIKSIVSLLGGDAVSLPDINYGQLRNPVYRKLVLWSLEKADEVIVLTQYLINRIEEAGSTRYSFRIIPWGIDTNTFYYRKKELDDPIQFLHIANLHPVKDQVTLLKAFQIISKGINAHLSIIGAGIDEGKVRALIQELELKDNVTMLGQIPNSEMPRYYHQSDILLHTSLSEGQSEVVTEAMCCGVLVCGTKVGLIHDLPDCCVSVPVKNYQLLADEVLAIITNAERRHQKLSLAYQWCKSHPIDWTVQQISECYR